MVPEESVDMLSSDWGIWSTQLFIVECNHAAGEELVSGHQYSFRSLKYEGNKGRGFFNSVSRVLACLEYANTHHINDGGPFLQSWNSGGRGRNIRSSGPA